MTEQLRIVDMNRNYKGVMDRDEVHRTGEWHETFQCLLFDENFVYFQRRAEDKKDFPDMLDISVGGHLTSDETIQDAYREIKEELGIQPETSRLKLAEIIKAEIDIEGIDRYIDREFAHVHTYHVTDDELQQINFEDQEVCDLISFEKHLIVQFFNMELDELEGISVMTGDETLVRMEDFVPHAADYYKKIAAIIKAA
ncbi:NUDIX domain-containing protein [Macrococcus equipercicus]|uniref:NUDIX domain-containing protein n=1 Tax=Macrococcus equipercicus TaxID=69967 RepID=A0ABQ6R6Z9_9STAP|nr:NUDIX domain-containing protein [Macrococcus equipercicus]KAA1037621.1 NUDIX domain-containing protein [Macrococcus equipercicus]